VWVLPVYATSSNRLNAMLRVVIFIDEIDAVADSAAAVWAAAHDEREQTLEPDSVEMDGFDTNTSVIVLSPD